MPSSLELTSVRGSSLESEGRKGLRLGRGQPSRAVTIAFAAFVTSLPFEAALIEGGSGLSISRLVGYVFFAFALLQPRTCFKRPPHAFWWFAGYLGLHALDGLFQPSMFWPEIFAKNLRLIQLLMVLWIGYNLFRYQRVVRWSLWGFGWGCVAVSGLLAVGIGTTQAPQGRETMFGQGANALAALVALGALTLLGMAYGRTSARRSTKVVAWGSLLVVVVAIARTGSRGGLVGLGAGLMTLMISRSSPRTWLRNAAILFLALIACYWITMSFEVTAMRWRSTLEEGNTSGRLPIFLAAWRMFEEKPLLGWGVVTNYYELGGRFNMLTRDTHNLFLWLLTELGVVGTIPFCIGLALCVRSAWRGRKSIQGLLPFALITTILTLNLSGTYYQQKWFWVILAYSLASENYLRARKTRSIVGADTRPLFVEATRPGAAIGRPKQRSRRVSLKP